MPYKERGKKKKIKRNFHSWCFVSQSTITSCVIDCLPCPLINQSYHMELFISKP